MRRFCFGLALLAFAAAARAEEAADRPVLVLNTGGHTAAVVKVLFTPDGKQVVTVAEDHTIRLWDRNTGERLAVLRLPVTSADQGAPRSGALAPDGKTLAVGGDPYSVEGKAFASLFLIDLDAAAVAAVLPGPEDAVLALAFSHDGKRLAVGDAAGTATIWDVAGRKQTQMLRGHKGAVHDAAFSPDDKLLATASEDGKVCLWDPETGKETCPPLNQQRPALCLAWQDDDALFCGAHDGLLHSWDRSGNPIKTFHKLSPPGASIYSLSFTADKNRLYYVWSAANKGAGGGVMMHKSGASFLEVKTESVHGPHAWQNHADVVCGALSPDGLLAAACGEDDRGVNLWSVADDKLARRLCGRGRTPFGVGWSADGKSVGWTNVRADSSEEDEDAADDLKPSRKDKDAPGTARPTRKDLALQRSFDLTELKFGPKPDEAYQRTARRLGSLQVRHKDKAFHVVPFPPEKKVVYAVIQGPAKVKNKEPLKVYSYTLLGGERVALGGVGSIDLYHARGGAPAGKLNGPPDVVWDMAPSPDGRYLIAAFSDQILRVYDPDNEDPLLSMFMAGSDWIAWTNEGYYAASPGGEKLMGWQVNNGLNHLGAFYPAEQFHKAFYRPDVIGRVLAEGSVEKAIAAADKESGQKTAAVTFAQTLPPEVALLSPAAGELAKGKDEVEVKAEARSKDRPVVTMQLLLDGRPCTGAAARTFPAARPGDKQEASWTVKVPSGEHHLVVLAESDASLGASPEVVVTRPAPAEEPLPTLYVLAVGINDYPGSLRLKWAAADAKAIQDAFEGGGAPKPFGKVQTRVLLDKGATKEGILAGLDWLKAKMTADDTAVVFYAGHGHRDKKTSQFYLLPQDVDVTNLPKTGVTGTQIKATLGALPGKVLVLLDACHSGSIGKAPLDPDSDDMQRGLAAPDCGVVILCAAMAQEEAGEAEAVGHGFFTKALMAGLGGKAPADKRDGLIHLAALDYYVEEAVADLTNEQQHVVVDRPSTLTSFPLVKPPAKTEEK